METIQGLVDLIPNQGSSEGNVLLFGNTVYGVSVCVSSDDIPHHISIVMDFDDKATRKYLTREP